MKQERNELVYIMTMLQAKKLVDNGLISAEEYSAFETKMQEKYSPKIGSLFTLNNLL